MAYSPSLDDLPPFQDLPDYFPSQADLSGIAPGIGGGGAPSAPGNALLNALSGIASIPERTGSTIMGDISEVRQDPLSALTQPLIGALKGAGNIPINLADIIPGVNIKPWQYQTPLQTTGGFLTQLAPITKGAQIAEKGVQFGSDLVSDFASKGALTLLGKGAAGGMAAGAITGAPLAQSAITGGLLSGIRPALGAVRQLPKTVLGGTMTAPQFEAAQAQVPPGIKAPLGDIGQARMAKGLYDVAGGILGSQASKPYEDLNAYLTGQKQKILDAAPSNVSDPNQTVWNSILKNYKSAQTSTQQAYQNLGAAADQSNLPFDDTSLQAAIKPTIADLSNKMKTTKAAKNLYGPIVSTLQDFSKAASPDIPEQMPEEQKLALLAKGELPLGQPDTPIPKPTINTFGDAVDQRPVINDLISNASSPTNPDPLTVSNLMKVKKGLDKSIEDSASSNPDLLDLLSTAKQSRIDQAKFENLPDGTQSPFYRLFLNAGKNADPGKLINQYIKPSTNKMDNSGLLSALTNNISPDARNVAANAYLTSSAKGTDTLGNFTTNLSKLNPAQRQMLLGPKNTPVGENMLNLVGAFQDTKSPGFQPKTGYLGQKANQLAQAARIASHVVMGGGATLGALGHPEGGLLTALAPVIAGQILQRGLRSPLVQNLYKRSLAPSYAPATSGYLTAALRSGALQPQQQGGTR